MSLMTRPCEKIQERKMVNEEKVEAQPHVEKTLILVESELKQHGRRRFRLLCSFGGKIVIQGRK